MRILLILSISLFISITANAGNTYYVATYGENINDGVQGTSIQKPWKSISYAASVTGPGDIIEVRAGTYRGEYFIPEDKGGVEGQYKTIKAYQSEVPYFKGSKLVGSWTLHNNDIYKVEGWDRNSQQVFVDGKPLQQIGWPSAALKDKSNDPTNAVDTKYWQVGNGIGDLKNNAFQNGSFYYDNNSQIMYLWLKGNEDPNTKMIEVSYELRPFHSKAHYLHIKDLRFMHSNTLDRGEMLAGVLIEGDYNILENLVVAHMDFGGIKITLSAKSTIVKDSYIGDNGNYGLSCNQGDNFVITGNQIVGNNTRNFNASWHAGGIKSTGIANGVISHNTIQYNRSDGVWWDVGDGYWGDNHVSIHSNFLRDNNKGINPNGKQNGSASIHYEISKNGRIFNNVIVGGRRGIYISASSYTDVVNNTIVNVMQDNGLAGIEVGGVPRANGYYKSNENTVLNNIIVNTSGQWSSNYKELKIAYRSDALNNKVDNNLYYRLGGNPKFTLMGDNNNLADYPHLNVTGLSEWAMKNSQGFDQLYSKQAIEGISIFAGNGDYHLVTDSEAIDGGAYIEWLDVDKDNNPRGNIGDNFDIGAYEYIKIDTDNDGIYDNEDNCPVIFNPQQEDTNKNGIGDHCEPTKLSGFWPGVLREAGVGEFIFIFGKNFMLPNAITPEVCYVDSNVAAIEYCTFMVQVISDDMLIAYYPGTGAPLASYIKVMARVNTVNGIQSLDPVLAPTIFGSTSPTLNVNGLWPGTVNLSDSISDAVFVFGKNFDLAADATHVTINGVTSYITMVQDSDLLITFIQPGMTTGPVCVTVASDTQCSATNLEILQ